MDIYVEDKYVRAVRGGIGFAKTGGNYAASIRAGEIAEEKGYTQVLWLDGVEQKYVEEVGAMNMMFVIDGKIVTRCSTAPSSPASPAIPSSNWPNTSAMRPRSAASPSRRSSTPPTPAISTRPSARHRRRGLPGGRAVLERREAHHQQWRDRPIAQKLYDTLTGIQYGELRTISAGS